MVTQTKDLKQPANSASHLYQEGFIGNQPKVQPSTMSKATVEPVDIDDDVHEPVTALQESAAAQAPKAPAKEFLLDIQEQQKTFTLAQMR